MPTLCQDNALFVTKLVALLVIRHYYCCCALVALVREKGRERAVTNLVRDTRGEGGRLVVRVWLVRHYSRGKANELVQNASLHGHHADGSSPSSSGR